MQDSPSEARHSMSDESIVERRVEDRARQMAVLCGRQSCDWAVFRHFIEAVRIEAKREMIPPAKAWAEFVGLQDQSYDGLVPTLTRAALK